MEPLLVLFQGLVLGPIQEWPLVSVRHPCGPEGGWRITDDSMRDGFLLCWPLSLGHLHGAVCLKTFVIAGV